MKTFIFSLLVLISTGSAFAGPGTEAPINSTDVVVDEPNSLFDRLAQRRVQEVRLTIDMAAIEANRRTRNKLDATFFDGHISYPVDVSVRGKFRRITCEVPPLKLQFKKDALRSQGLNTHNDFKLVTLCGNNEAGVEAVKREQLAYELHALITGYSFRTQLLRVTYVDARTGAEDTQYGILIEDEDQMAERLGGEECNDCYNLPAASFVPGSVATTHLFQYLIGNTDYSIVADRNIEIVALPSGKHIPVAYDFDFSGMVNAFYARPNVNVGQTDIEQRVWMGSHYTEAELQTAVDTFNAKEGAVYNLVENCSYIDAKTKRQVKSYLKGFYRDINKSSFPG